VTLAALLRDVTVIKMVQEQYGKHAVTHDVMVHGVRYDSRAVTPGDAFVALRGGTTDGHRHAAEAAAKGAAAVILEEDAAVADAYCAHTGVTKIVVPDTRTALAVTAANFYGHPSRSLRVVGVTGTNGKTTTTHVIRTILEAAGERVGLIGTIGYRIGADHLPATHTTPEAPVLQELLARMVEEGCTSAVMEVSSHALALRRVHGLRFAAAAFTNLTQDHLDFHGSMDAYAKAKAMLFRSLDAGAVAVTNADDPAGSRMVEHTAAPVLRYGVNATADVRAENVRLGIDGTRLSIRRGTTTIDVATALIGRFNVQNLLAAWTVGVGLGIPDDVLRNGASSMKPVRGRFEQIAAPAGWTAVIDYAHTPDALASCLSTIREILPPASGGRVITVFGCGGDRDRTKRPLMGAIAGRMSDITILTSDNPRSEDPLAIIREIRAGVDPGALVEEEPDRRTAIRRAAGIARTGDVVLIAGKGHETVQITGDRRVHFDDREEVEFATGINA
jgi:UDP-N-acetylmuramoyl-L-alanyl-D-glutamate--2,6-diaminopimelate ligase